MKGFDRLYEIVCRLRDPENGCPWDLKQTSRSLLPNLIEEVYEVVESVEEEDSESLKEELGDVMLHVMMQIRIAEESSLFFADDVFKYINNKLVSRHPHIFGDAEAKSPDEVKMNWEKLKMKEKKHRNSVLEGIPHSMPAVIVAQRIQEKAASVGFDWRSIEPVISKIKEEIDEFEAEYKEKDFDKMEAELGDMLFATINLARKLKIDSETALRRTIRKFESRFQKIEKHHKENNLDINKSSLEMMDEVWTIIKEHE